MKVRQVNDFEEKIIYNSLSQISPKFIVLLKEKRYYLFVNLNKDSKKNQIPIYLIYEKLSIEHILNLSNVYSFGLYFGFVKRGFFFLSLEGADFLHNENLISEINQIIVNQEGEKAILYGNNVLKKMVISFSTEIKIDSLIVVLNELKEMLAIGITKIEGNDFNNYKSEDLIVSNLVDKGYYLRKEH